MKKVAILLGGRGYTKTAMVLPYTSMDYRIFRLGEGLDNVGAKSSNSLFALAGRAAAMAYDWAKQYVVKNTYRLIQDFQPDVIYTNCGLARLGDMGVICDGNIPVVVRLGGHIYEEERENTSTGFVRGFASKLGYKLAYRLLAKAKRVVVVSKDMAKRLVTHNGQSLDDIAVVPVPCNIEQFDLPKTDVKTVLIVSHLNFEAKVKALQDFLPALTDYGNVKIIAPGRYHDWLQGATTYPVFGFTNHIECEYQKASVFCYFSYLDGCPNVILEAWASHTPVIANQCSWSEELIQHEETGLLVSDADEARACIDRLLTDKELAKRLADNGYQQVQSRHRAQIVGQTLGQVLKGVAKN